jgi:hypothetical protein
MGPLESSPSGARRGLTIWFTAAATLVIGILVGFTTGFNAGQRNLEALLGDAPAPAPAAAEESATTGSDRTFSEAVVSEPSSRADRSDRAERSDVPDANVVNAPTVVHVPNAPNVPNGPTDPNGSLSVISRPAGAQVVFDGRIVGRTPLTLPSVPAGSHSVRLELPGFNRWATSVDVNAGARARVAASLEQP